jgi:hypothetical protein
VECVRNRIERFRSVFGSTDGYGGLKELGEFMLREIRLG